MEINLKDIADKIFFTEISLGEVDFNFDLFTLLLTLVLPLLIIYIAFRFLKKGIFHLLDKSKIKEAGKKLTKLWFRRSLNIIYFLLTGVLVSNLLGAGTVKYIKMLFDILNQPFIESGGTRITIITIILTIPVFYIANWAGKSVRKMINRDFLDRIGLDDSRKFSFVSIIQYAIMIVFVLIGLSIIGIDLSALTLIFGVLGIGLGFGLQHTVSNLIAGLQIIFTRPVKEGDRIIVNGIEGTVTQIRLNSTTITTLTNESIIIPNFNLVQNIVHNYSYENKEIVIANKVQISYGDDPEKAAEILNEIGKENPWGLKNRQPAARFKAFGDSGLDMALFTWIIDVEYKFDAHDWTNRQIWKKFKENNISIPFPHIQLKTDSDIKFKAEPPEEK
jgi:small-conductance mechanosensitive channel